MKYFILALLVFIAVSDVFADDEKTFTEEEKEKENARFERKDRKERSVPGGYDPAIMSPGIRADAGLLFRRKIRSDEGGCCCC